MRNLPLGGDELILTKTKPPVRLREAPPQWVDEPAYSPLVERYLELREEGKAIHEEQKDIAAALRRAADQTGIRTDSGTVRCLEAKGRVNWNALAKDLRTAGVLSKNMIETYRGTPGRRIEVRESK